MFTPKYQLNDRQMAVLLASLVAVMPFSVDAYLPSTLDIARALGAQTHDIERSLSAFMLGVAIGQLSGGSLSDIKGRRNIALKGLLVYVVSSLALVFVQTADQLLLLRLVQALGAGMASVVVGAVVRDNYRGNQAAQMFALIGIIMMAAPMLAPQLGALLNKIGGWRSVFAFLFVYGAAVAAALYAFLPQHKQPEKLKAAHLREVGGRYRHIIGCAPAMGVMFFQAASFASMLVFLSESPAVYMEFYGLSSTQYALVFACNIFTMMCFNRITAWRLKRGSHPRNILNFGIALQLAANGGMLLAILLSGGHPPLALLVLFVMVSVGTQGFVTANTQALFMGYFKPEIGGGASSLLSAFQSLVAACAGFAASKLHNGTPYVMAGMMLAMTVGGFALLSLLTPKQPENKAA